MRFWLVSVVPKYMNSATRRNKRAKLYHARVHFPYYKTNSITIWYMYINISVLKVTKHKGKQNNVTQGSPLAWRKRCFQNINSFVHTCFHQTQVSLTQPHLMFLHLAVSYPFHFQPHFTSYKLICMKMKKTHSGTWEDKRPIVDVPIQKQLEQMPKNTEQQLIIKWPKTVNLVVQHFWWWTCKAKLCQKSSDKRTEQGYGQLKCSKVNNLTITFPPLHHSADSC
jgi:hypothetical protein